MAHHERTQRVPIEYKHTLPVFFPVFAVAYRLSFSFGPWFFSGERGE